MLMTFVMMDDDDGWMDGSATTYVELVDLMKPRSANAWHGIWALLIYIMTVSLTRASLVAPALVLGLFHRRAENVAGLREWESCGPPPSHITFLSTALWGPRTRKLSEWTKFGYVKRV